MGGRRRLVRLVPVVGDGRPGHRRRRVRARRGARRDRHPGARPGAPVGHLRQGEPGAVRLRTHLLRPARFVHGGPQPVRGASADGRAARHRAPDRRGPGHARAGYRRSGGGRLRRVVRAAVPRGDVPQPLCRSDVHPAVGRAAPSRRDDQAQPAARGRERQAPGRRGRLDRARDDDQADRRSAAQGRRRGGPRPDQRAAHLPPVLLRHRYLGRDRTDRVDPHRARDPRVHRRGLARATCPSAASWRRWTCRTSGSASPASTATTRSPSRTTSRAGSSCWKSRCPPVAETRDAYRAAGVDVAAGERAVELMREHVASTRRPEVVGGLGGFGGAFGIPAGYVEPLLIASSDGVGTKTAIAGLVGRFDTIGIDLVAMCADDVVCTGAEPLAFLDYIAVGHLDPLAVAELVGGVAAGCREAGCALVGGETAEHPGLMDPTAYDLAGTAIGVVERSRVIDGTAVRAGDAIVGLAASGLHANGYSLVRALLTRWELDVAEPYQARLRRTLGDAAATELLAHEPQFALATLGEVLLTPTRIYARTILALRAALVAGGSRRPRSRPHHRRRATGQCATRAPGRPGRPPGPRALVDAVGHAAVRRPRRPGRAGTAFHVQRRPRHDRRRRARGGHAHDRHAGRPRCGCRRWSARSSMRTRSAALATRRRRWRGTRRERADRRRRVGERLQPAGPRGGGDAAGAGWGHRARLRGSGLPGPRLGGGAGDRHRARPGRRRRDPGRHARGGRAGRGRPGGLHADRRGACARRTSAAGSSTPTRRCCPRSPVATRSPTRWRMGPG